MGYKNRTHRQRRVISERKFSRIFASNLDKSGVAYRTVKWETQRSLAAVMVDGVIYAKFACKKQSENRLQTFCIRYLVEEPLDFITFIPYANPVQSQNDLDNLEIF